jgi:hypothetical protein
MVDVEKLVSGQKLYYVSLDKDEIVKYTFISGDRYNDYLQVSWLGITLSLKKSIFIFETAEQADSAYAILRESAKEDLVKNNKFIKKLFDCYQGETKPFYTNIMQEVIKEVTGIDIE